MRAVGEDMAAGTEVGAQKLVHSGWREEGGGGAPLLCE